MVLVAYRHALRASEVCDLQWHQVQLEQIPVEFTYNLRA
jgi:integrase